MYSYLKYFVLLTLTVFGWVFFSIEENHFGMLTPEKPPINDRQSSFYDRLRSWFDDDKD